MLKFLGSIHQCGKMKISFNALLQALRLKLRLLTGPLTGEGGRLKLHLNRILTQERAVANSMPITPT